MSTLLTSATLLVWSTLPAFAGDLDLTGHWSGSIELPGMALEIDVDFSRAAEIWNGDITIPAQGARDLPLEGISQEGTAVAFAIAGIPGDPTFAGALSEDGASIAGTFTQGGQSFPFSLSSGKDPAAAARVALEGFDAVIERGLADLNVPGVAIAILVGDEPVLLKGFGLRDVEQQLPVTEKTIFAIGSSTKAFTAFVLGTLVDEGTLDWDEPLLRYLPDFRMVDRSAEQRITPRDLVTHRCGLPRHDLVWYNNTELTRKEIVARIEHLEPNKDLRQTWQYNNLAFLTAGYLAEVLTGRSWEECVRERILLPLGMTSTNFSVAESQPAADFALGYEEKEGRIERMPFRAITNMGPAGSINSNVEEMARWVALQLRRGSHQGRPLIGAATLTDLHTPQMVIAAPPNLEYPELPANAYAMGWFVQPYRGHYRLHHGGNIDGFSAFVSFLPQDDLGFVILTNSDGTPLGQLIERTAIDRILGLEGRDWIGEAAEKKAHGEAAQEEAEKKADLIRVKGTKPAHPLKEYAGEYEHPGYGILRVELPGRDLAVVFNHITNPLEHWHYEVFNCAKGAADPAFEDTKIQFLSDMGGHVEGLRVAIEPQVDEIVFKRRPDARLSDPAFLAHLAGAYELVDQTVNVEVKGNGLTLIVPGQPPYDLIAGHGTNFTIKGLSGFSLTFVLSERDEVMEVRFNQPNGVFTAKPVKAD
ncbi:MAG: serine hydrolase [Candidatus Eisenbacteria bacterium]